MPAALTSTDASRSAAEGSDVTVRIQTAQDAVEAARAYAGSIAGKTITRDRAGGVPYAELAALDASGLLAITVPRAFGGPELGATALAEVIATIAATGPAIAQVPQAHYLFTDVLAIWGTTRSPGSTTT
jgi:alkylation response protein AidB-like acyl-CoA dehydrogenase